MPAASIEQMEAPTRSWAAQQGLKAGYGLSNYVTVHNGFVYHGHNGGVEGGLTEMAYIPEYGVGFFFSINSGNISAFGKIGDAIRSYITRGLTKPVVPAARPLPVDAAEFAGWYEPDAPRNEMMHFLERLQGMSLIRFDGSEMPVTPFGRAGRAIPVSTGKGTARADCHGHYAGAEYGGAVYSDRHDDETYSHVAGVGTNCAGCMVFVGDCCDSALCTILDLRGIAQETARASRARHTVVAAHCCAELAHDGRNLHDDEQ